MWLLEEKIKQAIERAESEGLSLSASQSQSIEAASRRGEDDVLSVTKGVAKIEIEGVLTKKPSFLARWFGGGNTTYASILSALAQAEQDEDVKQISFAINSPGGEVNGLFEVMDAIKATSKPTVAVVYDMATSAAYGIASQADRVLASSRASSVGSVGVAVSVGVRDDVVTIASTEAPKKRPDVTTPEGVAVVQEELDGLHQLFAEAISAGRGTTVKKVNTNFGQGATILAEEALNRGMIDGIGEVETVIETKSAESINLEGGSMDLQTLKSKHPEVHALAVEEGVAQERDRVEAHLTLGEASGDLQTAFTAIKDGSGLTNTIQAKYAVASMGKRDLQQHMSDDSEAGDVVDNLPPKEDEDALAKKAGADVIKEAAALVGVELKGDK
jgi:ClpP class serine protease